MTEIEKVLSKLAAKMMPVLPSANNTHCTRIWWDESVGVLRCQQVRKEDVFVPHNEGFGGH